MPRALLLALLALPQAAHAWKMDGNPILDVEVKRNLNDLARADVYLDEIRVHKCGGGYDAYPVGQFLDLTATFSIEVAPADVCAVSLHYGTAMEMEQVNDGFIVQYTGAFSAIEIVDDSPASTALAPVEVIRGPFTGKYPRVWADFN